MAVSDSQRIHSLNLLVNAFGLHLQGIEDTLPMGTLQHVPDQIQLQLISHDAKGFIRMMKHNSPLRVAQCSDADSRHNGASDTDTGV